MAAAGEFAIRLSSIDELFWAFDARAVAERQVTAEAAVSTALRESLRSASGPLRRVDPLSRHSRTSTCASPGSSVPRRRFGVSCARTDESGR